jgi:hypothetical protein
MMLLLIALLAATPLAWVVRHRGRRREHQEGKVDGALLLGALVCALIALVMSAVAATRSVKERRAYAASRPIETTVDACTVSAQRVGGRDAVRSHELRCELVFLRDSQPVRTTVWAGYPRHRAAYDEWVGQHLGPRASRARNHDFEPRPTDRARIRGRGLPAPHAFPACCLTRLADSKWVVACPDSGGGRRS